MKKDTKKFHALKSFALGDKSIKEGDNLSLTDLNSVDLVKRGFVKEGDAPKKAPKKAAE